MARGEGHSTAGPGADRGGITGGGAAPLAPSLPTPPRPRRRDRHGRGFRGMLLPPHLPGHLTRREIFDDTVLDCAETLMTRFGRRLEHLAVSVQEIPSTDPAPWEMQAVPLGRYIAPDRDHPPQIVLYRRPIVSRCSAPGDLAMLVRQVLAEQIGAMLAMDPEDVDPGAWEL